MFKSKLRIFAIPVTLTCLALGAVAYIRAERSNQLPRSGWSIGFHSYHAAGFDSIPLRVTSVRSEGLKGLTRVQLQNRSDKPITAVKIGWYLSTEDGPGTILTKGESPLLSLPDVLQPDQDSHLNVPPVSLAKILKPFVKGNTLRGDFSVQVVVTEIVYADGSTWKFSQPDNVARIKINYAHPMAPCANQTCKFDGTVYHCVDGAGELCTNQGQSCDSSACPPNGD